jgi:hypothetical protein
VGEPEVSGPVVGVIEVELLAVGHWEAAAGARCAVDERGECPASGLLVVGAVAACGGVRALLRLGGVLVTVGPAGDALVAALAAALLRGAWHQSARYGSSHSTQRRTVASGLNPLSLSSEKRTSHPLGSVQAGHHSPVLTGPVGTTQAMTEALIASRRSSRRPGRGFGLRR